MTKRTHYIFCFAFAAISCGGTSNNAGDTGSRDSSSLSADRASATELASPEASAPGWMDDIAAVYWDETDKPGHQIRFTKPTRQGDVFIGEFQETYTGVINICQYEIVSEGVLDIQIIKTIREGVEETRNGTFTFRPQLLDGGKTLQLQHSDGRTLRYTRAPNSAAQKETKAEPQASPEKAIARLWMDKIAAADWKNVMNHQIVRFSKPVEHGDLIQGEMELHEESFIQVFSYERGTDGTLKCNLIRFKVKGDAEFTEERGSGNGFDVTLKTELLDDGNALVLHHANGKIDRYKQ